MGVLRGLLPLRTTFWGILKIVVVCLLFTHRKFLKHVQPSEVVTVPLLPGHPVFTLLPRRPVFSVNVPFWKERGDQDL